MNNETNRTCPFCAETIKSAAKLCPHCRQWLVVRSFRHPLVSLLVFGLPMCGMFVVFGVAFLTAFDRIGNPKPYYSEFPGAINILESRMNWVQTADRTRIFITGILTNNSPVAWKDLEFDCRFYDKNGTLLDAGTGRAGLTIEKSDDTAFRVSWTPGAPTNEYSSFKISVSSARNARGWF